MRIAPDVPSTQGIEPRTKSILDALKTRSDMQARRHPGLPPIERITATGSTAEIRMLIDKINELIDAQQI